MCNCGKRRAAIPGTGHGFGGGGGTRGLPVARALPSTVAPMPSPQVSTIRSVASQPRGIQQVRRAAPVMASVAPRVAAPAPVPVPSVASQPATPRSRGVHRPTEGIDPVVWGPHAWYILHTLAELAYRRVQETGTDCLTDRWASLIVATAESIPCPTCARHFRTWMREFPFEASMAAATVRTRFAELHNIVNRTKKVPEWSEDLAATYTGSATDVRERIASMRGIIGEPMLNAVGAMLDILGA